MHVFIPRFEGCDLPTYVRNYSKSYEQVDYVKFEIFTTVTMNNAVFWDVAQCLSCVNRRFGGKYRLHLQGRKSASEEPA
jgi:hypothetical protein